jgi:hypothetical protein
VTVPPIDPRAAQRASLRRAVVQLIAGVLLLDAVAMAIYYLGGIAYSAPRTRMVFLVVWTVVTALTVAFLLKRVRAVRFAGQFRR